MSDSRSPPRTKAFWTIAILAGLILPAYAMAVHALVLTRGAERRLGWSVGPGVGGGLEVTQVDANGAAFGTLQTGDRMLEFNGSPPLVRGLGWVAFMDLAGGDPYRLRVARGTATLDVELVMQEHTNLPKLWLVQVPLLLISFSSFVTGVVVGLLRPADHVARLYAALGMIVGVALIPFGVFAGDGLHGWDRVVLAVTRVVAPLTLTVAYHFFSEFPPGVPSARVWRRIRVLLYLYTVVLLPGTVATARATSLDAGSGARFIDEHRRFFEIHDTLSSVYLLLAFAAIVAVIVRNHVGVRDVGQRRRFRLVFWGSLLSAGPFALVFAGDAAIRALTGRSVEYATWLRAQGIAGLFLVFMPVTFAYAVVRHRVIGIDVVMAH